MSIPPESADMAEPPEVPVTGHPGVDEALAGISLGADVNDHPAALAEAMEVLAQALAAQGDAGA
ncbi:MAG: hypothetical protein ACK5LS_04440 [Propioniciclava sp.]